MVDPLGLLSELPRGGGRCEFAHILHHFGELFETEIAGRAINGCPEGCGDSIPLPFPHVAFREVTAVEHDTD